VPPKKLGVEAVLSAAALLAKLKELVLVAGALPKEREGVLLAPKRLGAEAGAPNAGVLLAPKRLGVLEGAAAGA
jgi:hypothetical protein